MLATSTGLEILPLLKERAMQGVSVRIILGSPKVVASLRGESQKERASRSLAEWRAVERDSPGIEVRETFSITDAILSGGSSFDDETVRFAIYDPYTERSQQAEMVVFGSQAKNVVEVFNTHFDRAWTNSQRSGKASRILARTKQYKWCSVAVGSFLVVLVYPQWSYRDILVGVTATAVLLAAEEVRAAARRILEAIRGP